jgi:quinol monooxygenase YgiN
MPTISENGPYTLIIEFEVDPSQQLLLIDSIADEVERSFRHHPAFISASFHASRDGRRVVNYAQWQSEEAYRAFWNSGGTSQQAIGQAIRRLGARPLHSDHYQVRRVIESATVRS